MVKHSFYIQLFIQFSFQLAHAENPNDISLMEVLAHIRTQRHGLIQTPEQLR